MEWEWPDKIEHCEFFKKLPKRAIFRILDRNFSKIDNKTARYGTGVNYDFDRKTNSLVLRVL